jgi:hypothetical protein
MAGWDLEMLHLELKDLSLLGADLSKMGFTASELAAALKPLVTGLTDEDEVPELAVGVPKVILDKLTMELNVVGQEPDLRKRLDTFGVEFSGLSGEAFADFARKERETLAPFIEKANIKPN